MRLLFLGDMVGRVGRDPALVEGFVDDGALDTFDRDGGFIREGYHAKLDELKSLRDHSKKLIANLFFK